MTGYFIGLAATRREAWLVAWVGLAIAAVLHGLNDWGRVNGHSAWIVIVAASAVLFLGYARGRCPERPTIHRSAAARLEAAPYHAGRPGAIVCRRGAAANAS